MSEVVIDLRTRWPKLPPPVNYAELKRLLEHHNVPVAIETALMLVDRCEMLETTLRKLMLAPTAPPALKSAARALRGTRDYDCGFCDRTYRRAGMRDRHEKKCSARPVVDG